MLYKYMNRLNGGFLQVTNTICQRNKVAEANGKLESMDISPLLAESIRRMHNGESISLLFTDSGPATFA